MRRTSDRVDGESNGTGNHSGDATATTSRERRTASWPAASASTGETGRNTSTAGIGRHHCGRWCDRGRNDRGSRLAPRARIRADVRRACSGHSGGAPDAAVLFASAARGESLRGLDIAAEPADTARGGDHGHHEHERPEECALHSLENSTPGASLKSGSRVRFTSRIWSTPSRP